MSDVPAKASPPVAKVKMGAVTASIWENRSQDGRVFYSFTLQRTYVDQQGQFRNTEGFRPADCMPLTVCVQDCFRWISTEGKRRARQDEQPDDATWYPADSVDTSSDAASF